MTNSAFSKLDTSPEYVEAAKVSKAWPFEEARKIVKRYEKRGPGGALEHNWPDEVLFETGYGPSGLPHIGTFGEVARTSMVINAFRLLTEDKVKVRLLCFSDDMDGMRKIPDNVPNKDMLEEHLGKPLTQVPDPFGDEHPSFGEHNNARLCAFLDQFGFTYEFASSTEYYKSGKFDELLLRCAEKYDEIMGAMLPTLGEERRATYSPFLPISPTTGRVLYVPMKSVDAKAGTVTFDDEDGSEVTLPITGGHVKLQWKPDFSMRWAALDVDFEMYGKDHQNNSNLYDKMCRIMGGRAPEHFIYELFLDDKGEKISKSKGNGITMEQWLSYASPESLSLFMFTKPKTAKRLFFDVIPKQVDEYFQHLSGYHKAEDAKTRLNSPAWHIHGGNPPEIDMPISFSMLLNLVSAANASDKETLWGFISQYDASATPQNNLKLDELVGYAISYFEDFVKPNKNFRAPTDQERGAMDDLAKRLARMSPDADAEALQTEVFAVGKEHGFENLREWFQALYQVLLGQDQGPRFGSFTALYGKDATVVMINEALER
jgi:lysyl-tRNA synthetase class 1